jgi:hypothetical protein
MMKFNSKELQLINDMQSLSIRSMEVIPDIFSYFATGKTKGVQVP